MTPRASNRPFRREALRALSHELPVRALIPLAIAVFALFSVLGPVIDLLGGAQEPIATILRMSLLSGLVSLGYAYGGIRKNYWIFALALLFQFVWLALESHAAPAGGAVPVLPSKLRLAADGALVLLQIVVSYTFFLIFINNTARRYLLIRAEVELAHQIHQVLVPPVERRVGAFEFLGFSHPSGEVGGDLVDVVASGSPEPSPGWFGYVADVSGHGVSSGLVMGMFKSALRMRLRQPGGLADLLGDLNSVLLPLKNPSMYVTVACVGFDDPHSPERPDSTDDNDTLDFAVAGHLPILRLRDGAVAEITTPQVPIGMFESYSFTASTVDARRGDLFILLTDGFVEVFDKDDHEFGLEQVKLLLARTAGK
ncbi:MAG TPA: PP2C family protein-serine/threonine phosphatase, partial [Vicinamibacterales bacterium]|nr:PP2C family protein-serine/threonine phosphatase [Vicinamibacterales bacterium]